MCRLRSGPSLLGPQASPPATAITADSNATVAGEDARGPSKRVLFPTCARLINAIPNYSNLQGDLAEMMLT
jgi:hypothetical protein